MLALARSQRRPELRSQLPDVAVASLRAIASVRERKDEIPQLLDSWLVSIRSRLRFAALTAQAQQKLRSFAWRGNLQELRVAADHLAQLAHFRSERQATSDTEITRSASRSWRKRLGLSLPLTTVPADDVASHCHDKPRTA